MKAKKMIFTITLSLAPVILSLGGNKAYADQPTEKDLNACYNIQFNHDNINAKVAFKTAQCFSKLAKSITDKHLNQAGKSFQTLENIELMAISDRNVVLQYADSWYQHAAFKGHPTAIKYLDSKSLVVTAD